MFVEFVRQNVEEGFVCDNYDNCNYDVVVYHAELKQVKLDVRVVPVTPIPGVANDFGHYVLRFHVMLDQDAIEPEPINAESFCRILWKCDEKEAATVADAKIVLEHFMETVKLHLFAVASFDIK